MKKRLGYEQENYHHQSELRNAARFILLLSPELLSHVPKRHRAVLQLPRSIYQILQFLAPLDGQISRFAHSRVRPANPAADPAPPGGARAISGFSLPKQRLPLVLCLGGSRNSCPTSADVSSARRVR